MFVARVWSLLRALIVWSFKAIWAASVVAVPAIGVWVASSTAAYCNGPVWLACLCGLLLFPLAPLLWEGLGTWRRARQKKPGPRILTFWDRLILRTLIINLGVLAVLLARDPKTTFAALSTRGDWILDGREGPRVEAARRGLFFAADRLQWLYEAVHANAYEDVLKDEVPPPPPPVLEDSKPAPVVEPTPEHPTPEHPTPGTPKPTPATWPLADTLHPLVLGMPAEAEASIAAVGKYIAEREPDRRLRVKALHDYVADRVAYDGAAYLARHRPDFVFPPQDAETVFAKRLGVCAGYAQLLAALGDAAGEEIVIVTGDARVNGSDATGESHAWNAARIDDTWHLIDATWDSGNTDDRGAFKKRYRATYLFVPAPVFAVDHFPREPNWQLLARPLSRGEFFRGPMMDAAFFAQGLELVKPDRSQVSVDEVFEVTVKNPRKLYFMANFLAGDGTKGDCVVDRGAVTEVRCTLPRPGTYQVKLYAAAQEYGSYPHVGAFEVQRGG